MLTRDSIFTDTLQTLAAETDTLQTAMPQTPYQVLRLLPKEDVSLPQYYRENYFSGDSLYHEELDGGRYGVAGDPVPYNVSNDHVITSILLVSFMLMAFAASRASDFIVRQAKNFFYTSKVDQTVIETGNEIRAQLLFMLITCLLYALIYHFYTLNFVADTFILSSDYALPAILFGIITVYYLLKLVVYTVVDNIFFGKRKNLQYLASFLFITSIEGILLFPAVLLLAYFHFSIQNAVYYCISVLVFVKLLTFYRTYIIFFRQKGLFLQIILYFCALEAVPLFTLWGGLQAIVNLLKVNY